MTDYKIHFKNDGGAGFPADSLDEAHEIAVEYSSNGWYILFRRTTTVKGWLRVGDNYSKRKG